MGRKVNSERLEEVVQTIREHNGEVRANDIAKELDLHPEAVARLLAVADRESEELLIEDDKGYLGIFKKWW
jgi:Mn-dependent DtxR family transcriptional regulator